MIKVTNGNSVTLLQTVMHNVEPVCLMKRVAVLRGLLDGFCGTGGLSESDFAADKRGKTKAVLLSAIGLILIGQLLLGVAPHTILTVAVIIFVYFLVSIFLKRRSLHGCRSWCREPTRARRPACTTPPSRAVLRWAA
ncbi:hypothetical protein R75465_00335 [Paraburkholderia aspalathi]|nr:hypothetical protein R75465_00335 [Paraburkholderia aspalathi]